MAGEVLDGAHAADALGGGSNPDVYRVAGSAGCCVMKFFPEGSLQAKFEADSISRADEAGLPVPAVYGQGELVTSGGLRPWLAMESVDGEATLANVPLTIDERTTVLRSLGVYLAQLPGLAVFNHKKGRLAAAEQRAQEVGRLLAEYE